MGRDGEMRGIKMHEPQRIDTKLNLKKPQTNKQRLAEALRGAGFFWLTVTGYERKLRQRDLKQTVALHPQ